MSEPVVIKPAGKNLVRNPDTGGHLGKDGENVVLTSYWRRRIKDGDVTVVKQPEQTKEKK